MIYYNYETNFKLDTESTLSDWIERVVTLYSFTVGEINYIFCDDAYLLALNKQFLSHDTLTDIISFDDTIGKLVNGDVFISIERVRENAIGYNVSFEEELYRVMIHGILHYLGFKDKTDTEKEAMRNAENKAIFLLRRLKSIR